VKQELKGPKARNVMNLIRGIKITPFVPPLQGGWNFLATDSRAFSPGCNITGFQPSSKPTAGPMADEERFPIMKQELKGPKARNVIARAIASPTSGGPGLIKTIDSQAL
jgi:hypothetical protein